jgi:HlyD family secretion protein
MRLFLFIAALCAALLGINLWSDNASSWAGTLYSQVTDRHDIPLYQTSPVRVGELQRTVAAIGSLKAVATVEVSSQLSGQVATLKKDFNESVRAGETLAELDQRGYRAQLRQAEAEYAMARESVALLQAKLERAQSLEQEALARRLIFGAQLERARVTREAAKKRHARAKKLSERGIAAKSAAEDARAELDSAGAELHEAKARADAHEHVIASNQAGRREAEAELANARAALPFHQAAVTLAELDLERSTIRAPIDGVVVGRNVEQGQTVAATLDAPVLFTVAGDLAKMEIHASVDETDIAGIAKGQEAKFTVEAFPGRVFPASVKEIRKAAVNIQGVVAYTVVLRAANPEGWLLPGMTATVRISVENSGRAPILPLAALGFVPKDRIVPEDLLPSGGDDDRGRTVWVLQDKRPEARQVLLGTDNGRDVAVIQGDLAEGEMVITAELPAGSEFSLLGIRFQ